MWLIVGGAVIIAGVVRAFRVAESWDAHPYTASKEKLDRVAARKALTAQPQP